MVLRKPDRDPAVWTAAEMSQDRDKWTYKLTQNDLKEIDTALRSQTARRSIQVSHALIVGEQLRQRSRKLISLLAVPSTVKLRYSAY